MADSIEVRVVNRLAGETTWDALARGLRQREGLHHAVLEGGDAFIAASSHVDISDMEDFRGSVDSARQSLVAMKKRRGIID
ncbi:hypothetical protein TVH25_00205 [Rhodococcus sp. 7Tela_A2]|uniref:hypothetical protein n=1 Tax=Rhodococcus sp. 7Tela_A2 TaxID=3093744 RepID=UPI003BB646C2